MTEEAKLLNAWYYANYDDGQSLNGKLCIVTTFIDYNDHLSLGV